MESGNMIFKTKSLSKQMLHIVQDKGTERPFSGDCDVFHNSGTYLCRQCGVALYRAQCKFHSACGWPSFDSEITGAVERRPDIDGIRTEILCARCHAHLGHVFHGEGYTANNIRHCVNSLSLDFVEDPHILDTEEAIFAAGCFWGVEYYFQKLSGVVKTEVGYCGGHVEEPNYTQVCHGSTGHLEAIRVVFDPTVINYEKLVKYFFEIHDFTQTNGQGPDLGEQYFSAIFYYDESQKKIAQEIIQLLQAKHYPVATRIRPVSTFWIAEADHQDYYTKTGKQPYCHRYIQCF